MFSCRLLFIMRFLHDVRHWRLCLFVLIGWTLSRRHDECPRHLLYCSLMLWLPSFVVQLSWQCYVCVCCLWSFIVFGNSVTFTACKMPNTCYVIHTCHLLLVHCYHHMFMDCLLFDNSLLLFMICGVVFEFITYCVIFNACVCFIWYCGFHTCMICVLN